MQLLDVSRRTRRSVLGTLPGLLLLALFGCQEDSQPDTAQATPQKISRPVRVLVVDDGPFAEVLARQWSARVDSEIQLRQMSVDELEKVKQLGADIVIHPASCLGTLAHRRLIEPPAESVWENQQYDQRDVFDLQRNAEVRWGSKLYAFSFGSPQLVLIYRADVFAHLKLQPPRTWDEYQQLVERLGRSELGVLAPPNDQPWTPVCEPLAAGWAGKVLLARAASYASHPSQFSVLFDYTTMDPLVAGPPFVRALEELVAAGKAGPADAEQLTPELARRRLMAGQTAVALGWPCHATSSSEPLELATGIEIAFAELPGTTVAYSFGEQMWTRREGDAPFGVPLIGIAGMLGSVTSNARRPLEVAALLALLTGKEWSERLSPSSTRTTLFRQSQLKTPQLWTDGELPRESSENYAEVVRATQARPSHVSSIRIPGWRRYLEALDQAVFSARSGKTSAQDALKEAAEAWAAITDELGLDAQRDAYTRSLGLEP